jgi:hypothetical protein
LTINTQPDTPENTRGFLELEAELIRSDKGAIKACEYNARALLARDHAYDGLHLDEFLSRVRLHERDWSDHDDREALCYLQSAYQVPSFTLGHIRNAVQALAYQRRRDSLREHVESLAPWDQTARIENAFRDAWGAADDPLIRAASRNFFIALIARALRPGAQVDTLWVFEGPQGSYKSRSLRALCGKFHAEISAGIGTTDFQRELQGLWLAELSELDSLRGKEASTVKRLLSAPVDRFVQKYEQHARSYPRRAVSCATTNESHYWQDASGARRLIPVRIGRIDIAMIHAQREQWFAEARQRFIQNESWWDYPAGIEEAQDERQHADPWEDTLAAYMARGKPGRAHGADGDSQIALVPLPEGFISSASIMRDWLRLEPSHQGSACGPRLGRVMRRLGYVPAKRGKGRERGWEPAPKAGTSAAECPPKCPPDSLPESPL